MLAITPAQHQATGELVDLVASAVGKDRAIHPETAISASARLSGSLLMRSFKLHLDSYEPGAVLLSPEANEKGPMLVNTVAAYLARSNIQLDQQKLGGQQAQRGAEPQLDFLSSLSLLQDRALAIGTAHQLSMEQTALAAALATGFIVKECAPQIGAETGFNVAAYGFVEGSKTVPPKSLGSYNASPKPKPWYKFW
jgi:hypothetical protein